MSKVTAGIGGNMSTTIVMALMHDQSCKTYNRMAQRKL